VSFVWKEGGASVTLSGDLDAWATQAMRDATGGAIDILTETLQPVASTASAGWYGPGNVQRVTGQSGRIEVVHTIDANKGVVRVSVGSTDTRVSSKGTKYQTKSGEEKQRSAGAPVPNFVHRPYAATTELKAVTREQFFAAPKSTRVGVAKKDWDFLPVKKGDWVIRVVTPRASDGKTLLPIYVNKPGKEAVQGKLTELGAAMAVNMGRKNG
jgi:hypothetical protein